MMDGARTGMGRRACMGKEGQEVPEGEEGPLPTYAFKKRAGTGIHQPRPQSFGESCRTRPPRPCQSSRPTPGDDPWLAQDKISAPDKQKPPAAATKRDGRLGKGGAWVCTGPGRPEGGLHQNGRLLLVRVLARLFGGRGRDGAFALGLLHGLPGVDAL